jgi:hypothetical protein
MDIPDTDLVLMDGHCSPETQALVDAAKSRLGARETYSELPPALAAFVADVVTEARKTGKLTYRTERVRYCPRCKARAGYVKYQRGRNKGRDNIDKPRYLAAVDFHSSSVYIQHHVSLGVCLDCFGKIRDSLRAALVDVRAELPEALQSPNGPHYKRRDIFKCKECAWTGPENKMRLLPALMEGHYHGGCPNCPAENRLFQTKIEQTGETVILAD